jgi:hypothetical protein
LLKHLLKLLDQLLKLQDQLLQHILDRLRNRRRAMRVAMVVRRYRHRGHRQAGDGDESYKQTAMPPLYNALPYATEHRLPVKLVMLTGVIPFRLYF